MSTVLDTEPVVLEELDFTPTCDWAGCSKDATWQVFLTCGCAGVICDEHQQKQAQYSETPQGGTCNHCGTPSVHVARFERL
ncbi:hypothetical protein SEA_BLAB_4 [Microbacterium phage Blab]|nr:hypothetical protein SEA_BLAB_4 [Microbacterium phage Blab]UVG34372.1 hypothetical protein SEA_GAZEBO_3 [Microbacterium phage Gazebo]